VHFAYCKAMTSAVSGLPIILETKLTIFIHANVAMNYHRFSATKPTTHAFQ